MSRNGNQLGAPHDARWQVRRDLRPDDPRHGTTAGKGAGCRCRECRAAAARYKVRTLRLRAYGRWQPFVDAAPVRAHLAHLAAAGMGRGRVAELAGVSLPTVIRMATGRSSKKGVADKCRPATAEAILSVQVTIDTVGDRGLIDSTGTLRRLRALVAMGWHMQDLGQRLPGHPEATRFMIRNGRPRVTGAMARAARDLYRQLVGTMVPETMWTRRTRKQAAGLGWMPPGAWDDATIDDPEAVPYDGLPAVGEVTDWVAIERALKGAEVQLTSLERHYAVHAGRARDWSYTKIANALRMSASRAQELGAKPLPEDCEVAA